MEPPRRQLPFYVIGHKNPRYGCDLLRHWKCGLAPRHRRAECRRRSLWRGAGAHGLGAGKGGIETPPLITDVRTSAGMICRRDVVQVSPTDTFLVAYRRMLAQRRPRVPVVESDGSVQGILRYLDLLELLVPGDGSGLQARTVNVSLGKIATTLQAESVGAEMPPCDVEEELILLVGVFPEHGGPSSQAGGQGGQCRPLLCHLR